MLTIGREVKKEKRGGERERERDRDRADKSKTNIK